MKPDAIKRANRELRRTFNIYNKRYFGDQLSETITVEYGKTLKGSDGNFHPESKRIVIDESLINHFTLSCICLLHEMAHAALEPEYIGGTTTKDPYHGMRYQARLVRLFDQGAYDGLL